MCHCGDRKGRTVVQSSFNAAPALLVITCFDSCGDKHPFGSVDRISTVSVDSVCHTEVPVTHLPRVYQWMVLPFRERDGVERS